MANFVFKVRHVPLGRRKVTVPPNIQRIECRNTKGWQVRLEGTAFFSDSHYGGMEGALSAAIREKLRRVRDQKNQGGVFFPRGFFAGHNQILESLA
mgnify:CR=1 FL=1